MMSHRHLRTSVPFAERWTFFGNEFESSWPLETERKAINEMAPALTARSPSDQFKASCEKAMSGPSVTKHRLLDYVANSISEALKASRNWILNWNRKEKSTWERSIHHRKIWTLHIHNWPPGLTQRVAQWRIQSQQVKSCHHWHSFGSSTSLPGQMIINLWQHSHEDCQ
jgi:hypothetical protein